MVVGRFALPKMKAEQRFSNLSSTLDSVGKRAYTPLMELMQQCPKFSSCNAPVCPLDPAWRQSQHIQGEPVCFYLRESFKTGRISQYEATLPGVVVKTLTRAPILEIFALYPAIAARLRRACSQPSKAASQTAFKFEAVP